VSESKERNFVWIGPIEHPEIVDHWHYLRLYERVHLRASLGELVKHPVTNATDIVVVGLERAPLAEQLLKEAKLGHPNAGWVLLEGSSFLGSSRQRRSGVEMRHVPWYSPTTIWLDDDQRPDLPPRGLAVLTANRHDCLWLAEVWGTELGPIAIVAATSYEGLHGFQVWLWDDSAIWRLGETEWLRVVQQKKLAQPEIKQFALTSLVTWQARACWRSWGVEEVLVKPMVSLPATKTLLLS
jgi:hypothetical protein